MAMVSGLLLLERTRRFLAQLLRTISRGDQLEMDLPANVIIYESHPLHSATSREISER